MLGAILVLALAPQNAEPATPALETLRLGAGRAVTGAVLKETERFLFVDLGFDVVRVPLRAIVRRERTGRPAERARVADEQVFSRAELPEISIAQGAARFGPAVVKILSPAGQGSGFVTSLEGHVVTNFHVVRGETEVSVTLYLRGDHGFDVRTVRGVKVLAVNPHLDLALLKMRPPKGVKLRIAFLGDSERVKAGQKVYAIGAPIGLERTVSSGIVSVTNRTVRGIPHFQITVPINPGNSGGPLFDLRGEVVGVTSSGYLGLQGLNFAIPSRYVIDFLRHRDAFVLDHARSENGIHYLPAPRRPRAGGRDRQDSRPTPRPRRRRP